MNTLEIAQLLNVLRQSGSYNDAEPLYCSVRRLVDERDSERARAARLKVLVEETSLTATAATDRVRALEREVARLSVPSGSPIGYDPKWPWLNKPEIPPPATAPAPSLGPDTSRMGRQRRELRRLNAAQRVLRMEADLAARRNEDAVQEVLRLRRQLRVLESAK